MIHANIKQTDIKALLKFINGRRYQIEGMTYFEENFKGLRRNPEIYVQMDANLVNVHKTAKKCIATRHTLHFYNYSTIYRVNKYLKMAKGRDITEETIVITFHNFYPQL
jgi:hypothetical protein